MKKVVLDVFGADKGPKVVIEGAINALKTLGDDFGVILVGDESVISEELKNYRYDASRVDVIDAKEQITNNESPTLAIRTKKDSSLVKACDITKSCDDAIGMISAGSTGAVLTAGIFRIGRIRGVLRPALCPMLPTADGGRVCICDCGANMDCKSEYLRQFALMANEYYKVATGAEKPKVALVSVGVEDKKGNDLTHAAFAALKESDINFVGNMEARDALTGMYDVLVCDGFVGNVLLKSIEGSAKMVAGILKEEIYASTMAKIGAIFMKKSLANMKARMDYHAFGGAVFLGIEKPLVKSHGSSNAKSITACVEQILEFSRMNLIDNIKAAIAKTEQGKDA